MRDQSIPLASPTNSATDIWSDSISLEDFSNWLEDNQKTCLYHYTVRQVRKLITGKGITRHVRREGWNTRILRVVPECFYKGKPIHLASNFDQILQDADQFEKLHSLDDQTEAHLKGPIKLLRLYKECIYSSMLQERIRLFHIFLATTKRHESPSSVLGTVGIEGVLKSILDYLVPRENNETTLTIADSVDWLKEPS